MTKIQLKGYWVHLAAFAIFFTISLAYFPSMIEGKTLRQHDVVQFRGMSKEIRDFRKATGQEALWTNSMFGGMPAYLTEALYKHNYMSPIRDAMSLWLGKPSCFIFFYLIGFYIALLAFRVNPWLSIVGAISFAFSSYFFVIIDAGHITKAFAIGFMAPVIGAVYLAYNRRPILGAIIFTFFFCFQLLTNHLQIVYYTFLTLGALVAFMVVELAIARQFKKIIAASAFLAIGGVLAVGLNFSSLYFINEYGKSSMRGKSELTHDKSNKTSGLDRDYATNWSYGIGESWTLLVPNFNGGGSSDDFRYSDFYKQNFENYKQYFVNQGYSDHEAEVTAGQAMGGQFYWGAQPGTSGPVYAGAIVCLLFVLGLFVVRGKLKWWLVTVSIIALMLSWGKNFMWFTNLWFDFVPGYDKFRTVTMILVIVEFAMPLLGILALNQLIFGDVKPCESKLGKAIAKIGNFTPDFKTNVILKSTLIILGLLLLLLIVGSSSFDFRSPNDSNDITREILDARKQVFVADIWRSFFYVLCAGVVLLLWLTNLVWKSQKKNINVFYLVLGLLILLDMWSVDKRYVNESKFVPKYELETPYQPTVADKFILDNNPEKARVLNLSVSTFNDASTSYFHQSIGGYHGAKMKRYQELIEMRITPEIQQIYQVFSSKPNQQMIDSVLLRLGVLNMLNTRFIIYNGQAAPIVNSFSNGHAWFVSGIKVVENADEEIAELGKINTRTAIVVDKRFSSQIPMNFALDNTATIKRVSYAPNKLVYESSSTAPQVAVFSEIYYDKGWNAYVDGKLVPHFRANYVLRAMNVPAGNHTIEFKFEPAMYNIGGLITLGCFLLLMTITILYIVDQFVRKDKALK